MTRQSRREFLETLTAAAVAPAVAPSLRVGVAPPPHPFRVRTLTAGVDLPGLGDLGPIRKALTTLARGRKRLTGEGWEVQTVRIALPPVVAALSPAERRASLGTVRTLDELLRTEDAIASLGPVSVDDRDDDALPGWLAEVMATTERLSASIVVASSEQGVHRRAATTAARAMDAIARAVDGGVGNFRFAAAANVPAGTPFFPVAWHRGPDSLALGLETASFVGATVAPAADAADATRRLVAAMDAAIRPLEELLIPFAESEGRTYLGVDTSPAPGMDRSIGAAIEALTHRPFGGAGTLEACAAVTSALKGLAVGTCGYSGLMLPVLEDPVLARRATEGRYGVRDLLLYSSVCGTGLDVVPIPGDTPVEVLAGLIRDTAALSAKWKKALSDRLLLVPGKAAGDMARFADPLLTDCAVLPIA